MIAIVLSLSPPQLRGSLTLWLAEIATGVYVGQTSARVRDELWKKITEEIGTGRAIMAYTTNNEQGYAIRTHNHDRQPLDYEGLILMMKPSTSKPTTQQGTTGWSKASRRRQYQRR